MASIPILTVCTGNICRSPLAALALERHLGARGVSVAVRSSGTMGGLSNDQAMRKAAAELGYDLSEHVSRRLNYKEVEVAALVLAMDRSHVEQIVVVRPTAWNKVYTLAELVRRARALPPDTRVESFSSWLELVGDGRTTDDLLRGPASDDIEDPHRRSMTKYRAVAEQIESLVVNLSELLVTQVGDFNNSPDR